MSDWIKYQEEGAKKVVSIDDNNTLVKYVAGVDISFDQKKPDLACGYITVVDYNTLQTVYEDHMIVTMTVPYVSGFLGFRETPLYTALLSKLKQSHPLWYPDVVMVDGSGILHHRGFGSASQLGVELDVVTIGCAKTLLCVDGLIEKDIKTLFKAKCVNKGDSVPLIGNSGKVYGVALKGSDASDDPIFVSVGHKISIDSAVKLTTRMCKYRIPEPIRNSDIKSKLYF